MPICFAAPAMHTRLTQRYRLHLQDFILDDECLLVRETTPWGMREQLIPLEKLGTRILRERQRTPYPRIFWLAIATLLAAGTSVAGSAALLGGLCAGLGGGLLLAWAYLARSVPCLTLVAANSDLRLRFFAHCPTPLEVETFVRLLIKQKCEALRERYGAINPLLSYEQNYLNLEHLRESDVISRSDYRQRLDTLDHMYNGHMPPENIANSWATQDWEDLPPDPADDIPSERRARRTVH